MRQIGAIFFVAIFVLGTATTALIVQQASNQSTAAGVGTTPAAGATVVEATVVAGTPTQGNAVQQIIDKADEAAAKNDWKTAAGFYKSAVALSPSNPTLLFKYGKALGYTENYADAVDNLQKALDLNPSATFAGEAQQFIETYKPKITPGAQTPAKGATGSGTITATMPISK